MPPRAVTRVKGHCWLLSSHRPRQGLQGVLPAPEPPCTGSTGSVVCTWCWEEMEPVRGGHGPGEAAGLHGRGDGSHAEGSCLLQP